MKPPRRFLNSLRLINNRRRSFVSVEFRRWIPRLRIIEKYESPVKWTLRAITVVGIVSGAIAFRWYVGLAAAAGLAAVEQVLERVVFLYTSLYVQPMPRFNYIPDEWLGMVFGQPADPNAPEVVAPIFRTELYAREFFRLLQAWNYNEVEDRDNNVCVSFIIEDSESYSVYLYPSTERRSITEFSQRVENEALREKPGKEHFQLVIQFMFCHMFNYNADSHFERFRRRQRPDRPLCLSVAVKRNGEGELLRDAGRILKFHWKIKERRELTRDDMEYEHGKLVIGL